VIKKLLRDKYPGTVLVSWGGSLIYQCFYHHYQLGQPIVSCFCRKHEEGRNGGKGLSLWTGAH
jgi:hypothetical protein